MEDTEKTAETIAHELNNILMAIGVSLEMLSERVTKDESTTRLFAVAHQGIDRGAKLNQQLLDFSRNLDLQSSAARDKAQATQIK